MLHHGDCLEVMAQLPDASVDMILCDLPYGTTACKWDTVIPFEPLWAQYRRVAKRNAAIVLTASQPFTTALIASNMREFKYEWIWYKNSPSGFANAHRQPMKAHENVCVFYAEQPTYNRQDTSSRVKDVSRLDKPMRRGLGKPHGVYGSLGEGDEARRKTVLSSKVNPRSVLEVDVHPRASGTVHPTQKPVALMEYLIRTYTREGETVLDNCMGSGTTGVACVNTGRQFVGIERDSKYFAIASERIAAARQDLSAA